MAEYGLPDIWPPAPYSDEGWGPAWLRIERQYPGSGRPSRSFAHATVPYSATITLAGSEDLGITQLGTVARAYLEKLDAFVQRAPLPQSFQDTLLQDLASVGAPQSDGILRWCPVWPPLGAPWQSLDGTIASWNLSGNHDGALPAAVILTATEGMTLAGTFLRFKRTGFRLPAMLRKTAAEIEVVIRGLTAELPTGGNSLMTHLIRESASAIPAATEAAVADLGGYATAGPMASGGGMAGEIAARVNVQRESLVLQDVQLSLEEAGPNAGWRLTSCFLGLQKEGLRAGPPLSVRVTAVSRVDQGSDSPQNLLHVQSEVLATSIAPGAAKVFPVPPPDWIAPGPGNGPEWRQRRPPRADEVLDNYRETVILTQGVEKDLQQPGFQIRRCPGYVPADAGPPGTKTASLPGGAALPPRCNLSAAISAYYHSKQFFELMAEAGLPAQNYVATAKPDIEIYYRSAIAPGPGKNGRTINAQVVYDCSALGAAAPKPGISMHLALANLNRWGRPLPPATGLPWAQPLGIACDGRWMMHEFGHYLLAARIGQLEFDFAHSPGDAMAAVFFDPLSQLADAGRVVAESFRGLTYPFIFAARRHDRDPALGWAWYGHLNRSAVEHPPCQCYTRKGYISEQILSSSVFRLYRCLGGDSLTDGRPDKYQRLRASRMTLILLMRAIAGLAQPPSRAEMLEEAMESAGWLLPGGMTLNKPVNGGTVQDVWQAATTHKTVRWAFEQQGMFPVDPLQTVNGPGAPPPVDIYIRDRRPIALQAATGPCALGPGSYAPVSLHWSAAADWTLPSLPLVIGNRGSNSAQLVRLRLWLGFVSDTVAGDWLTEAQINWLNSAPSVPLPDIPGGGTLDAAALPDATARLAELQSAAGANATLFLLAEVSCPNDRANTDPATGFATAVDANGQNLPAVPQAVIDLVANDNNLGLRIIA